MRSPRLFLGQVMHRRLRPAVHAFVYPVFYIQLPVRDLSAGNCRIFSVDRSNLLSFRSCDHGPRDGSPLLPWIQAQLRAARPARRRRDHAAVLPAGVRLRLQPGQLLVLPRPGRCADRRAGRGQQHLWRLSQLPAAQPRPAPPWSTVRNCGRTRASMSRRSTRSPAATDSASISGVACEIARIDYDDAEGELLLTAISGKAQALVGRRTARRLRPHAIPHRRRDDPHPLAGAQAVAERRALHWRACPPTSTGTDKMNNTMTLSGADNPAR